MLGLTAGLSLLGTVAVQAQTVYGLNQAASLLVTSSLGSSSAPTTQLITGITAGQLLVGLDSRPATGELFALGYNGAGSAQLYTINKTTGAATAVGGTLPLALGGPTERIGFDFNPTVDRIRVTSSNEANIRLNPVNGTVAVTDMPLVFDTAGPLNGQNPVVGTVAYTNSFLGTATTTLYDIDESRSTLFLQDPPNNGVLTAPVSITQGGLPLLVAGDQTDLDIYTNPATRVQTALLGRTRGSATTFYTLNLGTGVATDVVNGTNATPVDDIAFGIDRTAPTPGGDRLYAVNTGNALISFDSGNPGFILSAATITGITGGQTLVGTDFRPNTGQLFGLGYNPTTGEGRLYIINLTTAVAAPVGTGTVPLDLGTTAASLNGIGFDFNPTVDRIRVTGLNARNYRLNPNNGAVAAIDGNLNFVAGATGTPTIGAVAYTNSYAGSTSTVLYDIDDVRNQLFIQTGPNTGQLTAVNGNPLFANAASSSIDLDIYFDAAAQVNRAYAVSNSDAVSPATFSTLYSVNLGAAQTTSNGVIGLGIPVRDVAALVAPLSPPALVGRLLYGLAGGNLVSFDSGAPSNIRTAVNITGLPTDGSQVLAGADFRPLDGLLYAFGYNAATSQGQLYTLNLGSGALTAVGGLNSYTLGAAPGIGFDFNPAADRIRIIGANGNNYRINPANGLGSAVADGPTGRPLSAAAYTNNDNNATTATLLYAYDQGINQVVLINDPNTALNITNVGPSGITVNTATGVELDVFSDLSTPATPVNTAYAAAAVSGSTNESLYEVSLGTGSFSSLGRIGSGSNLSGLAAFITIPPVVLTGLTWTGSFDTNWGTAANWSPMQVPGPTDNVTIPNVANDPVVNGAQMANSVSLQAGATLTSADGSLLTVNGNFLNAGGTTLGSGTGTVSFAGPAIQNISGTTTFFNNLTAGPAGLAASGPVRVQRVLQLNGSVSSNGNLTLLSNATGTAHVVNSGGVVTGNAAVQRASTATGITGYRHYSAPVTGSSVADLATAGFSPQVNPAYNTAPDPSLVTPFPTVFSYDETRVTTSGNPAPLDFDKGFLSPGSTGEALTVTRGYTVNIPGAETVDFVGTLNDGAYVAGGLSRGSQTESGWQLLGNPYPSPIDWDLVGRTNVDGAVYVFRASGQYDGTYSSYVAGSGGVGINGGTDAIASGQGFFVRVTTPNSANGQVSFANSVRLMAYANPLFQRSTAVSAPLVRLDLRAATGPADEAVVYFEGSATPGFDSALDAYKLLAGGTPVLASQVNATTRLSINALPALTATDRVIDLHVAADQAGTHTLRAVELLNLPAGTFAYLRDAQTGTVVDLAAQPQYTCQLAAGAAPGRFTLLLTRQRVLANASAALSQQVAVYPNPTRGVVSISLPAALTRQDTEVQLLNSLGQTVLRTTLVAGAATVRTLTLPPVAQGVYTLRLQTAQGSVSKRLVVE
ncbi:DUF4394 domain-containing protein [Hymenobacter algoricola]|uniref:DUF4394 domain-containing protein n=1 Tax=Hymenobacter algoricola TaxID=486267 RepID=A0ABP7MN95_9BACT